VVELDVAAEFDVAAAVLGVLAAELVAGPAEFDVVAEFDVAVPDCVVWVWVCGAVDVGAEAGDDDELCVGVDVDVGLAVLVGVGVGVGVGLAEVGAAVVGDGCVAGVDTLGWAVDCCVGLAVVAWFAGALVEFPARDAVGLTPFLDPLRDECETSRTTTTATMTAATAAAMGQPHRRNGDGGPPGGVPPVPPVLSLPNVTAPGAAAMDVSGSMPRSATVAPAGMSARTVGSGPAGPAGTEAPERGAGVAGSGV
jgi:hypothetical protein